MDGRARTAAIAEVDGDRSRAKEIISIIAARTHIQASWPGFVPAIVVFACVRSEADARQARHDARVEAEDLRRIFAPMIAPHPARAIARGEASGEHAAVREFLLMICRVKESVTLMRR
jgi:hypothetical protein